MRPDRDVRRREKLKTLSDGPPSPCISVCQMDSDRIYCIGCYRTIDEIRQWLVASTDERKAILRLIEERRKDAR